MKKISLAIIIVSHIAAAPLLYSAKPVDLTDTMKQSLVFLELSSTKYEQFQPWKQSSVTQESGYGCAVGPYEILTTAENVTDATLLQARFYAQNEYVPATVKVVDYEYNLCLLTLDKTKMAKPLKPLKFAEKFPRGQQLETYWLSSGGHLTTARSTLDRAEMRFSSISFVKNLFYIATNISRPFGDGEVCCNGKNIIGLACWGVESNAGIIPAETINRFLNQASNATYKGFGLVGFEVSDLLDPFMRRYLKMPDTIKHGVYVSKVYNLGTGSRELKKQDVILSMDGQTLNPYGRYLHKQYDRISFENLIMQKSDGDKIPCQIWRDGAQQTIEIQARNFKSDQMLVPYYLYGRQPEYLVTGGFVFQKMTRNYFGMWGDSWAGKVPPHLYYYYSDLSFMPTDDRQDIVLLNYVLPAEINLGYQQLSRLVVSTINNNKIRSFKDVLDVIIREKDKEFLVVEFEMDSPKVVIPTAQLDNENMKIAQMYGIPKLYHIE